MRKTYTILLTIFTLLLYGQNTFAQFIVAQDTIRGRIDFCPRPGDFNNATQVPNDSVFYLYPPDMEIDPWRYVDFYSPDRSIKSGYIRGTDLMRIDDYDVVEVGKLSAHGTVFFQNDDVRVDIAVANVSSKDSFIKQDSHGNYIVNGKQAKGVSRWASPKIRYQSISATIKGKKIIFPKRVYEHLLNPEIDNMVVYYNPEKSTVYIMANNGGMEAFYCVLWAVSPKGVSNVYVFDPSIKK